MYMSSVIRELAATYNLSKTEATVLTHAAEILDSKLRNPTECELFHTPKAAQNTARAYFTLAHAHKESEVFSVMFLDNQHSLITTEDLFTGTIDGANIYPRIVVKRALQLNAAAVIFAHNHPSGVAEPSQADIRITRRLIEALELVDIRTLDHIIVGHLNTVSFAERGLL